ncbi:hypothetical protein [Leifsonia sp. 71-9]|uniref:hypothetical protein n=1 Tax=Leifsonia sp. 71-9 TaxID=1895934 RepID=UPI0009259522|nr:hypothetical protein [Leifsonia sp. 71-9]OJX77513.1 MAG: hypothetical protein BGO91_10300 [Leifsonia sp. 71-9]
MSTRPDDTGSENARASDEKPDEPEAGRALDRLFDRQLRTSRNAYLRASRRAELVADALKGDERIAELTRAIGRLEAPVAIPREAQPTPGELHTLSLVTTGTSDRLSFATPPYDVTWSTFQPPGAAGTQAHGPSVYPQQASMFIDLIETYVDRPVAEGGWMYAGAGLGLWFKPKAPSTYVRVSGLVDYEYDWADSSSLQVAHNRAQLCVMVQHRRGPGDLETILDTRDQLWADGTSWYEDHSDSGGGYWPNQNYFWASSDDWYLVWFWMNGGIDFSTKDTFGSSKAYQSWHARIPFLVFEQWV